MPAPAPDEIRAASRKLSAADFSGTIRSSYPYWDAQYRPYLLMAVDALPREHFDFKPRPALARPFVCGIGTDLDAQTAGWKHPPLHAPLDSRPRAGA